MALSNELINQFVKSTKDNTAVNNHSSTIYGTVVYDGKTYVKLDGSELLTPVSTTVNVKDGDRVTVEIKNHSATITGNVTDPSASGKNVDKLSDQITEFESVIAYKVSAEEIDATKATIDNLRAKLADINKLEAVEAEIETLEAKYANLDSVKASDIKALNADIENLQAKFADFTDVEADQLEALNADINQLKAYNAEFTYVFADELEAVNAKIDNLDVGGLTAEEADIRYAKINDLDVLEGDFEKLRADTITGTNLEAINADIKDLKADKLNAEDAKLLYANIDFANVEEASIGNLFAKYGIIEEFVSSEGHVTKELVGVVIKGDLIDGETIKAENLIIRGTDGLYYRLNTNGTTVESQQTDYNSLNGKIITAKSITATKVNVDDLVAFDATIGGFNITDNSIYSGVKQNVNNTTRGIYLDNNGQVAFGDGDSYVKYFKDQNGKYKLDISAESITLGTRSVEETINELENIQIGATNLIRNSNTLKYQDYSFGEADSINFLTDESGDIFVDNSNNLFIV